jgi:hypothetical protein
MSEDVNIAKELGRLAGLDGLAGEREEALSRPPPIPCLGRWSHTVDGSDFDCEYDHAGGFGCEDCIVNGGNLDPRTGRRWRGGRGRG